MDYMELLAIAAAVTGMFTVSRVSGRLPPSGPPSTESLPGIGPFDAALLKKFEAMKILRGERYQPRTKHRRSDGDARYTNRLFLESSPYLLQHAHNPVNWYPWGDEAFETAASLNRPVLLSIGYSTCHWCHVMEEESFEDEEVARCLNENYIAIKVDREERPDIDAIYMNAVQAVTGGGGWPMTVWLTPDRKPFFGGTYYPARDGDRGASTGFLTILMNISRIYATRKDQVNEAGHQIIQIVQNRMRLERGEHLPTDDLLHQVVTQYKQLFDPRNGGQAGAPKFPGSFPVRLLFRYYRRTGDPESLDMARLTLEKMAAGGIYDQVGGGFHRYATDEGWLIPHFEKMLYDNALLSVSYLEGYQVTGEEAFRRIVEEILDYVARDMTSPQGAFYSATDADSLSPAGHREEGFFFTWTPEALDEALGADQAEIVKVFYGAARPNFEGRCILHMAQSAAETARSLNMPETELRSVIRKARETLYRFRNRRSRPLRDEKILTAWNGLMISAYARAGLILGNRQYVERAVSAADFILDRLYIDQRLYRSYKDGQARHMACLDDYAFLIAALLDLYEATSDIMWLEKALKLDRVLEEFYEDCENGGFFMTGSEHEKLIAREKPAYDGAEPSGNSVALLNLLRLHAFTLKDIFQKRAEKILSAFIGNSVSKAMGLSEMLLALDFYLDHSKEIVIVTPEGRRDEADPFLREFRKRFLPNRVITVVSEGKELSDCARLLPSVKGRSASNGKTTACVCEQGMCGLPVQLPTEFAKQLGTVRNLHHRIR